MKENTRDRKRPIKVYVSHAERETIEQNASACNCKSVGDFLRSLGQGYHPKSRFDQDAIHALIRLQADQGRLGGLLKLWLSEKKGEGTSVRNVRSVLEQIEGLQVNIARLIWKNRVYSKHLKAESHEQTTHR